MRREVVSILLGGVLLLSSACGASEGLEIQVSSLSALVEVANKENEALEDEVSLKSETETSLKLVVASQEKEYAQLKKDISLAEAEYKTLESQYKTINSEYKKYKEKMSIFEGLSEAEAEARKIEAERVAAQRKADEERAREEAAAAAEAEQKKGYDTGITFSQLARTPDDYLGKKVKFSGRVIQVVESDGEVTLRIAVKDDYDQVILVSYSSSIVSQRVLDDDQLTIYGISAGTYTYQSTMGGNITVPAVLVDKIDFN